MTARRSIPGAFSKGALLGVFLGVLLGTSACWGGESPRHAFSSDIEECKAQMLDVYQGLLDYTAAEGAPPSESGVRFFATLIASGHWKNSAENARKLTCPAVPIEGLALANLSPTDWYDSLDGLGGNHSAYAGRNQADHPLPGIPTRGDQALLACDNHLGMNHEGVTNVLFADGSIISFELENERELGNLGPDDEVLPVGPDSPIRELRTLSQD